MVFSDQIMPISNLRTKQSVVMGKINNGPLYLAQRSVPVAVIMSNRLFDHILQQLEDKDDLIDALKVELAIAKGEDVPEEVDIAELESMIGGS